MKLSLITLPSLSHSITLLLTGCANVLMFNVLGIIKTSFFSLKDWIIFNVISLLGFTNISLKEW